MNLMVACDEMSRIVKDILVPEYLQVTHTVIKAGYLAEVVAYDSDHPVYPNEMVDLGVKFRCGEREEPCKFEYIGNPEEFCFDLTIRNPNGEITQLKLPFHTVIPRTIRKMIGAFLEEYFIDTKYVAKIDSFDQYDQGFEGPFRVQMEEDGTISDIATTDTMEEAYKMGATFSSMFKGKPLTIVDKDGSTVC